MDGEFNFDKFVKQGVSFFKLTDEKFQQLFFLFTQSSARRSRSSTKTKTASSAAKIWATA